MQSLEIIERLGSYKKYIAFTRVRCVELRDCQEQTLDHRQPNEKETQACNEVWQDCLRPRGRRERFIDDLHKITRGLQCSLKNSLSKD